MPNLFTYRLCAPVMMYPLTDRLFIPGRQHTMQLLDLKHGEYMLIPRLGTGAELRFLPAGVETTSTDLSPDMLAGCACKILHDEPSLLDGMYRVILLQNLSFHRIETSIVQEA